MSVSDDVGITVFRHNHNRQFAASRANKAVHQHFGKESMISGPGIIIQSLS